MLNLSQNDPDLTALDAAVRQARAKVDANIMVKKQRQAQNRRNAATAATAGKDVAGSSH